MKKIISGNYAAAYAVKLCRVQVVAAYPITPQTSVVEKIAEFCASGEMPARLIKVESEHSSLSACIGASSTGARVFTANSSQGLAYCHEMLHWAAGARLPIVLVNANRAVAAPWNIGGDQMDSLSQRDTGWMQFYCESNQEVLDTVIQAYRVAEAVSLPAMVCLDGFYLSHTYEPVEVPDIAPVDRYLPPYAPAHKLDPRRPVSFGALTNGPQFTHFRYDGFRAMREAKSVTRQAMDEFAEVFGRRYELVERECLDGPVDVAVVATGSVNGTIRQVVREMRAAGHRVGLAKLKAVRPFPTEDLLAALAEARKVVVIDRDSTFGIGGIICQEVKGALYNQPGYGAAKPVFGFVAGLGGVDITVDRIRRMINYALEHDAPAEDSLWVEVSK